MDGVRTLLGVLTIHVDLVLSPQKPLYDGTEEFQLVQRRRSSVDTLPCCGRAVGGGGGGAWV